MSSRDTTILAYEGAVVGINAVAAVALTGLSVLVFRNASLKRHSGAARGGFLFLKMTLPLTALVYLFTMVINATQLAAHATNSRVENQFHTRRLAYITGFFETVSLAILMSCIARLIAGIKMVVKQQEAKGYCIFVDVLGVLAVLLGFAAMVIQQVLVGDRVFFLRPDYVTAVNAMHVALVGLLAIGGLANTILSWSERQSTRKDAGRAYRAVGNYIAAIATVSFVVFVWSFVGGLLVGLFGGMIYGLNPVSWFVADAFITRIASFAVFFMIYKVGQKEENGLWLASESHAQGVPKSSNEISVSQV